MTLSPTRDSEVTPGGPAAARIGLEARAASSTPVTDREWWRTAAIFQVYVRSFADGNGDGIGDLAGVRSRLGYLASLGIDAIWFTPWYRSPLADGGYDVEDYRAIHPDFGTVAEAEALISEAAALGIRTIVDVVPNHVSDQHAWFREALASEPGSDARARFWFRDGKGPNGDLPPGNWPSSFSGSTWTRTMNPDGTPGQWYLHLFTPEQPDLNWDHPDVRREHEDVLRFWFDRGVAGVRIDSAALVAKDPELPEIDGEYAAGQHPNLDRDDLHEIYRGWRTIAEDYSGVLVGEIWLADLKRFALYLRPDEIHMAFNFDFMSRPWGADGFRAAITETLAAHEPVGAPATWVLSNHDVTRPVTRFGRADSAFAFDAKRFGTPSDLVVGARRARAAAMLVAALPGALYVYQGDELGLPEVEDIPLDRLEDPMHFRSGGVDPGRDGCRVPIPWTNDAANAGFSPDGTDAAPWLPQPADWARYSVTAQQDDPTSTLTLYRRMLELRRGDDLQHGAFAWQDDTSDVIAFRRGALLHLTNCGTTNVPLPDDADVVLASGPLTDHTLPADTSVWLAVHSV
ncbi:alpha-amylase family glycosyl hydrolase [Curtobacterium sp. MCBA15_001]|uniref:glycoside hydrolase family 13 protein n=1 Tax=Curtobacterium sp. MCBA15_001 TaxID=1898731 RepID=UPI0008DDE924|nr:alpha-amylase family glycosyl hydrolase [Curtobacterium sp. MCBA15_001]OIH92397.1 alpha-glucosidase [Curtobacterium sp. MCBA15_001]